MDKNLVMIGLGILKFIDVSTTYIGVGIQTAIEKNPVMNHLLQQTGLVGMLTLSLMVGLIAHYLILYPPKIFTFKTQKRKNTYQVVAVLIILVTYVIVVANNLITIAINL